MMKWAMSVQVFSGKPAVLIGEPWDTTHSIRSHGYFEKSLLASVWSKVGRFGRCHSEKWIVLLCFS